MKKQDVNLLDTVEYGGCSAKIPPAKLEEILASLPLPSDPNIIVDIDTHDDAGVYRISDDLALVVTTDFFPPVCSDPYEFGQIAAANSLSDIYAMGAVPLLALNIVMFPQADIPMEAYAEILKGGFDKATEAGTRIIGGHTIDDAPPKYGLAVVGTVSPSAVITNAGALPGDNLILTKPLGTGIIQAGQRLKMTENANVVAALENMKQLNRAGAELMQQFNIRGATDITGFGLGGHALKMAKAGNVTINIEMEKVPLLPDVYRLADEGCLPGASFRNLEYAAGSMNAEELDDYNLRMIAFDAQTSGGLLISVPHDRADELLEQLIEKGYPRSAIIGNVTARGKSCLNLF
jgi:selenide,water dikinase